MIKNYFKIAFRNLWRHRVFSAINVLGLTVGMTACFLIFLYVKFELSYDSFHSKSERIYRMVSDIKTPSETINAGGPSWAVAPHLLADFPEIEQAVRVSGADNMLIRKDDIKFEEPDAIYADSAFFKVFDFELIKGSREKALNEPFSIVFTEAAAKKYFGTEDPMGKTLLITGRAQPVTVTGIMKDMPENSLINEDVIVSMRTLTQKFNAGLDDQWGNYGSSTYILLKPNTDAAALTKKFPAFLEKHNGSEMKEIQMYPTLLLEPLREVYLYSTRLGSKGGNISNVYVFSVIAIFILVIACINFINLTTARSVERAKEVGIRKVVGALKFQLARQFIVESVLLCVIAFVFSVLLASLLLPPFNELAGKQISTGILNNPRNILTLFAASVAIGLLAGLYPAWVLSSFKPITVLKGKFSTSTRGIILRKGLVVAQFTISIALIIATIIVYNQMAHMRKQDLGFNKEQVMVIDTKGEEAKFALNLAVRDLRGVVSTAMSSSVPGGGNPGAYSEIENSKGDLQIANLDLYFVDYDYIPGYKMKMVAGRSFSKEFGTDTTKAMVINEAAAKLFGYKSPQEAIGKRFKQWGREGQIIGVVKNFNFRSLQQEIKPITMRIEPNGANLLSVKVPATNLPATIAAIEGKWKTLIPNRPFSYFFLDDFFDKQYRSEERFAKLFVNFAILAVFISCLGLLGLASYSTIQRTREIGIRKVMGASVTNIVNLLSFDFLKLVVLSFIIATPVAWYFMYKWLQDFSYRSNITWSVFAIAGILAFLIALFTISFQAIRAAIANPIKSLRAE
jgi:putative ABC transport system permease protein